MRTAVVTFAVMMRQGNGGDAALVLSSPLAPQTRFTTPAEAQRAGRQEHHQEADGAQDRQRHPADARTCTWHTTPTRTSDPIKSTTKKQTSRAKRVF